MDCHIVGREVLVWSGAGSTLVRDARCKLLACAHAKAGGAPEGDDVETV